jgi:hypothetical protein
MWLEDAIQRDVAFRCTESPQREFAKQSTRNSYAIRISCVHNLPNPILPGTLTRIEDARFSHLDCLRATALK